MYLLFLFLFGHFEISNLFSDFLFWFLSDFSRFLTFFSDLWFRPNSEVFWFLWEVPILNLFSEIRSWTRTFFPISFFHFRVLTLSTLITFLFQTSVFDIQTHRIRFLNFRFLDQNQKFWSKPFFFRLEKLPFSEFWVLFFFIRCAMSWSFSESKAQCWYFSWKRRGTEQNAQKRSEPSALESRLQEFWSELIFWLLRSWYFFSYSWPFFLISFRKFRS